MNALSDWLGTVSAKSQSAAWELVEAFRADGVDKLMVVTDFDSTLSKHLVNGARVQSSYNIVEQCAQMPDEVRQQLRALKEKYYPLEICEKLSVEEKTEHMVEWWTKAQQCLVEAGVRREWLPQVVGACSARVRDGVPHLLDWLHAHRVPVYVVSAGCGDVILELLHQQARVHPNMHLIANFMHFDDAGLLRSFSEPVIHTYCKHQVTFPDDGAHVHVRPNCLLLGDMLGDLHMTSSLLAAGRLGRRLTVGFLNDRVVERRPQFDDAFDFVVLEDETVDFVAALLRYVAGEPLADAAASSLSSS